MIDIDREELTIDYINEYSELTKTLLFRSLEDLENYIQTRDKKLIMKERKYD